MEGRSECAGIPGASCHFPVYGMAGLVILRETGPSPGGRMNAGSAGIRPAVD